MKRSAEVRWFAPADPPKALDDWFRGGTPFQCPPGGTLARKRADDYVQSLKGKELGAKRRGDRGAPFEIKGLMADNWFELETAPFTGGVQLWCKWETAPIPFDSDPLSVIKLRLLRKFTIGAGGLVEIPLGPDENPMTGELPVRGCNVELTRVEVTTGWWWTFGFEAFGRLDNVGECLRLTAEQISADCPKTFTSAIRASYPEWLASHLEPPR